MVKLRVMRDHTVHVSSLHVNFKCLQSCYLVVADVYTIGLLYRHLVWGRACGFFKEFSFAEASFHPS